MKSPKQISSRGYSNATAVTSLVLFALFFVVLLLALVAGVRVYSSIVDDRSASEELRMEHGFLVTSVQSADSAGSVSIGQGPEGPSLVISENTLAGTIETRIYAYMGSVVQEYVKAESPISPNAATVIFKSALFEPSITGNLVSIVTDTGLTEVALRADMPEGKGV